MPTKAKQKAHLVTREDVTRWRAGFQPIASSHEASGTSKVLEGSARGEYRVTIDKKQVCRTWELEEALSWYNQLGPRRNEEDDDDD